MEVTTSTDYRSLVVCVESKSTKILKDVKLRDK